MSYSFPNFLPEPESLVLLGGQIFGFQYLLNFFFCFGLSLRGGCPFGFRLNFKLNPLSLCQSSQLVTEKLRVFVESLDGVVNAIAFAVLVQGVLFDLDPTVLEDELRPCFVHRVAVQLLDLGEPPEIVVAVQI